MSTRELTAADCRDVLVVAITPRGPDGSVDLDGVRRNVQHLIDGGARFLMPMCGTGLVYDATLEEFESVTGAFVDAGGGRAVVVPGIGPGYGRALEMAGIARGLGVAGAMIMPIVGPASAGGCPTASPALPAPPASRWSSTSGGSTSCRWTASSTCATATTWWD